MNLEFSDVNLPYVNFSDLKNLPTCSGIYFVLDSNHIFYYIGKAENIQKRWKNHHRKDQIENIHVKYPVKVFWLVWNLDDLDNAEKYFINCYKPLLNNTKVELPKIIPSEIFLKKLLRKIARKTFAIGMTRGNSTTLTKIYLKYDATNYTSSGAAGNRSGGYPNFVSYKIRRFRY
ncbi:MAG: GIY-YIG nuclease family protein [Cyanobacteriota bacterium]